MIAIETTRFGAMEIEADQVITFIEPILGFQGLTRFVLLDHTEDSPFQWLQSIEAPSLAFVVTMPRLFNLDYQFELDDTCLERLSIPRARWTDLTADELLVLTMVTIPEQNPTLMTTNLLGPIIIYVEKRLALQVILTESGFTTKVRLLPDPGLPPSHFSPTPTPPSKREGRRLTARQGV